MDEAGRGPVVGPLVVGLAACEDPSEVAALGVRDSKLLSARRREGLYHEIRNVCRTESVAVSARELDRRMDEVTLNQVELEVFALLARRVPSDAYYLDACDVDAERFGREFARLSGCDARRVVSEHRADATYPLVSAASIIAKVERDRAIAQIAERLEPLVGLPLGSGYAHDETTRVFLERHLERFGALPEEARAAWATSRTLIASRSQRQLEGL